MLASSRRQPSSKPARPPRSTATARFHRRLLPRSRNSTGTANLSFFSIPPRLANDSASRIDPPNEGAAPGRFESGGERIVGSDRRVVGRQSPDRSAFRRLAWRGPGRGPRPDRGELTWRSSRRASRPPRPRRVRPRRRRRPGLLRPGDRFGRRLGERCLRRPRGRTGISGQGGERRTWVPAGAGACPAQPLGQRRFVATEPRSSGDEPSVMSALASARSSVSASATASRIASSRSTWPGRSPPARPGLDPDRPAVVVDPLAGVPSRSIMGRAHQVERQRRLGRGPRTP